VLFVAAYRDDEVDAPHPLHGMLRRVRESGVRLVDIAVDALPEPMVEALAADVLDTDVHCVSPLARTLHRKTAGNAFFVLQHLQRMFEDGCLRRDGADWQWDAADLDALPERDKLVAGLVERLQLLPADVQRLATVCACLGNPIDAELLPEVLDMPPQRVNELLLPLLQHEMLLSGRGGSLSSGGMRSLRFCHDRMLQAAHELLPPRERSRCHHRIAQVMAQRLRQGAGAAEGANTGARHDGARFALAEHHLAALQALEERGERAEVLGLLLAVGRGAIDRGAFPQALRFAEGAACLAAQGAASEAQRLELALLQHGALFGLARYDAADEAYAALAALPQADPMRTAEATARQHIALANRGRYEEAVLLTLGVAQALGLPHPHDGGWDAALREEVDGLYAALQTRGPGLFDELAPLDDPTLESAAFMLVSSTAAAGYWRPVISHWVKLRVLRLGWERGRFAALPEMMVLASITLSSVRDDLATGYALAQAGLRLQRHYPSARLRARSYFCLATANTCWFEPLARCIEQSRLAYRWAVEAGDTECASMAQFMSLPPAVDAIAELDEVLNDVTVALQVAKRTGDRGSTDGVLICQQFVRCLLGRTRSLAEWDDEDYSLAEHQGEMAANPIGRALMAVYRAYGAALSGDWPEALQQCRDGASTAAILTSTYMFALGRWVHALAISQALLGALACERDALSAEREPLVAWLERRALDAPANFGHWCDVLRAMQAWEQGRYGDAAQRFEAAIDAAEREHRPGHQALVCELAAAFHASHGLHRAAGAYRAAALRAYEAWGAKAKVAQLRAHGMPVARSLRDDGSMAALDIDSLLRAGDLLAHERDQQALLRVLFDLLRQYAGAEHGELLWRTGTAWKPRAGFSPGSHWFALDDDDRGMPPGGGDEVPSSVLHYLTQATRPLLVADATRHPRFGAEAAWLRRGVKSVLGLPIILHAQPIALLYLENRQLPTTLTAQQLGTLRLLGLQFAAAYENARIGRELENLLASRTAELTRNRNAWEALLAHAPAIVFTKDLEGRYISHTPQLAVLLGRPGRSLVGLRDAELYDAADAALMEAQDRAVIAEERWLRVEQQHHSAIGARTFLTHKFPLRDALGQVCAVGGMALDITEQKEAQRAAEAATRAKSRFLANMSHEIRTPMNAILGMSRLALQSGLTARQHGYVRKIQVSAESLLGIINDILDFSKIEAGKLDVEQVDFDLVDVLDNLANVVGMTAEEKGLELLYIEPVGLPTALVGDPLRLGQVLLNLGNNGVKFTHQGEVTLVLGVVEQTDRAVRLRFEVRDTGIGIDEADRQRLFQPFEQADASTSRRHGGTGLGLAISRQLVRLMGGDLDVQSTPGVGSCFFFTLPFELQQVPTPSVPLNHEGLHGRRMLVVDDNAAARELLADMARALGMRPDTAADGTQALHKLTRADAGDAPYDILLLDWKMPGMSGADCARRIAELNRPARRRPVAVLMPTASSRDEAVRRIDEQGLSIAALLTKPATSSTLFDSCCKALGLSSTATTRTERRKGTLMAYQSKLKGARVLLVEDNEINREVALELLSTEGLIVETAGDGREAVEILGIRPFDAVLMDCQMPVMDGFDATRALRARPELRDLPVIAMTASAMVGDRERALAAGMNDHIAKPIDIDGMFATLARWIGGRRDSTSSRVGARMDDDSRDWHSLPGVDAMTALSQLRGNEAIFTRMLRRFLEAYRDFAARFVSAWTGDDADAAKRMAHDLQSIAGTLGMHTLRQRAQALEQACGAGDDDRVEARLKDLSVVIGPIVDGVERWADGASEASSRSVGTEG